MNARIKTNRVAHFIAAYGSLNEKTEALVWERVLRGGWGSDDPASVQIAHDAILEVRMTSLLKTIKRAPFELEETMSACIDALRIAQAQGQADYARKVADRIAQETEARLLKGLPMLEAQLAKGAKLRLWHGRLLVALGTFLAVVFIGCAGYMLGRMTTDDLAGQFMDQAKEPDALTWLHLQRAIGNLDELIADSCSPGQAGFLSDESGRRACRLPMWLEGTRPPTSVGYFAGAKEYLVSAWAKTPLELLTLLGLFLAGIGIYVAAQIKTWLSSNT